MSHGSEEPFDWNNFQPVILITLLCMKENSADRAFYSIFIFPLFFRLDKYPAALFAQSNALRTTASEYIYTYSVGLHSFCSIEIHWPLNTRVSFLRDRNGPDRQRCTVIANDSNISVAFNTPLLLTHTRCLLMMSCYSVPRCFHTRQGQWSSPPVAEGIQH